MPVVCDSTKDNDIEAFFDRIKREEKGRLDILVNNAYAGVQVSVDTMLTGEPNSMQRRL